MKIERHGKTLSISEISELTAVNSAQFRDEVSSALYDSLSAIEVNLAQTRFMDSSGLGAVVYVLKHIGHKGRLHICGVTPGVMAVLKLTRMDRVLKTFDSRQAAIAA